MRTRHAVAAAVTAALLVSGTVATVRPRPEASAGRADSALDPLGRIETIVAVAGNRLRPQKLHAVRPIPGRLAPPSHPTMPASRSKDRRPAL